MLADGLIRLLRRVCGDDVMQAARRFTDGVEKFLVLRQDEHIDRARTDIGSGGDFLGIKRGQATGAVGNNGRAVLRCLHDDMFAGRLVRVCRNVIGRLGQCHESSLLCRTVDQALEAIRCHSAAYNLEKLLVADQGLEPSVVIPGEQDADGVGRSLPGFAKCLQAAHSGKLLSRDNDVYRDLAQRVQCLAAAGRAVHRIAIAEAGTKAVQGALFAVQ